jgi:hypothetical protein
MAVWRVTGEHQDGGCLYEDFVEATSKAAAVKQFLAVHPYVPKADAVREDGSEDGSGSAPQP